MRIAESPEAAAEVLEARRAALPALSRLEPLTLLEDATVPRSRIAEMVEFIQEVAQRHELKIGTFGHAGDGNLHPTAVLDPADEGAVDRAHAAFDEIFARAIELDGTITGEHGVGSVKLRYLEAPARRRPHGAAAADQGRLRPQRHPQPRKARLMSTADITPETSPSGAGCSRPSCSTAASPAASACPPARRTS